MYVLLFSTQANYAQGIKGKVIDKTSGETLPSTYVLASKQAVLTDVSGKFLVKCTFDTLHVTFKSLGYLVLDTIIHCNNSEIIISLEKQSQVLEQVVISAGKFGQKTTDLTVTMEVIKPERITQNNSVAADDVLDRTPGVNVINGQVNIRGGSGFSYGAGSRVLMLVDDMPLLSADAGDIKWNYIPIENVEQIEVIKGASSALYGSSALGGVINFRTASPGKKPLTKINAFSGAYLSPNSEFVNPTQGTFPNLQSGLNGLHSRRIGRHDVTVGGFLLYDQGFRVGERYKRLRVNGQYKYRFKNEKWVAGLNLNAMADSSGSFLFWDSKKYAFFPDTGTNSNLLNYRFNVDPYVNWYPKNNLKFSFKSRAFATQNKNLYKEQESFGVVYYNEFQGQSRPTWRGFNQTVITFGVVNTFNRIRSEQLYGNRYSNNNAAYLQIDQTLGTWNWSVGTRYETYVISGDYLIKYPLLRGGINKKIAEATWLRASYGEGLRNPSVAERFVFVQSGGVSVLPNPRLQNEQGWSAEFGVKQGFKFYQTKGLIDIAAFTTNYKRLIEFEYSQYMLVFGFRSENSTSARISGFEITAMSQTTIRKSNLNLQGGYTYIDPINLNNTSDEPNAKYLRYRYKHLIRVDVEYKSSKYYIGCNVRFNSFMINIDTIFNSVIEDVGIFRDKYNKGDLILDFRTGFNLNQTITVGIVLRNAMNRVYMPVPGNIGAPRTLVCQASFKF